LHGNQNQKYNYFLNNKNNNNLLAIINSNNNNNDNDNRSKFNKNNPNNNIMDSKIPGNSDEYKQLLNLGVPEKDLQEMSLGELYLKYHPDTSDNKKSTEIIQILNSIKDKTKKNTNSPIEDKYKEYEKYLKFNPKDTSNFIYINDWIEFFNRAMKELFGKFHDIKKHCEKNIHMMNPQEAVQLIEQLYLLNMEIGDVRLSNSWLLYFLEEIEENPQYQALPPEKKLKELFKKLPDIKHMEYKEIPSLIKKLKIKTIIVSFLFLSINSIAAIVLFKQIIYILRGKNKKEVEEKIDNIEKKIINEELITLEKEDNSFELTEEKKNEIKNQIKQKAINNLIKTPQELHNYLKEIIYSECITNSTENKDHTADQKNIEEIKTTLFNTIQDSDIFKNFFKECNQIFEEEINKIKYITEEKNRNNKKGLLGKMFDTNTKKTVAGIIILSTLGIIIKKGYDYYKKKKKKKSTSLKKSIKSINR
jgi:hypothetical protein